MPATRFDLRAISQGYTPQGLGFRVKLRQTPTRFVAYLFVSLGNAESNVSLGLKNKEVQDWNFMIISKESVGLRQRFGYSIPFAVEVLRV